MDNINDNLTPTELVNGGHLLFERFCIPIYNRDVARLKANQCFQSDTCMDFVIKMLNECRKENNIQLLKKDVKPVKVLYWSAFLLANIIHIKDCPGILTFDVMRVFNWMKRWCYDNGVGFFDAEEHIMYANIPGTHWLKFHVDIRRRLILIEDSYLTYIDGLPISTTFHKQHILALQFLLETMCIYTCGMSLKEKTGKAAVDWGKGFLQSHQQADGFSCAFRGLITDIHHMFGEPDTSVNYADVTRQTELDRKLIFYWISRGIIVPKNGGVGDPKVLGKDYYPLRRCPYEGCQNHEVTVIISSSLLASCFVY